MSLKTCASFLFRNSGVVKSFFQPIQRPESISVLCSSFRSLSVISNPIEVPQVDREAEKQITRDVIESVNEQQKNSALKTFAVVQVCGKQFKITKGDVIIVEGYWPPNIGDKIKLEKVLLAGSKDFSLIGTPLVQRGIVDVYATVIEKCLSHTKTHFRKKRRKQYMRINFFRCERTALRINEVKIGHIDEKVGDYE